MIVLAIDLGETTGFAYVRKITRITENPLIRYGTIKLGAQLPKVSITPDVVVIERPAYVASAMQPRYGEALALLGYQYYKKLHVIRPVDWKPRFKHHPLPGRGVLSSQHEKDAYRMACWALEEFGGEKS